MSVVALVGLGVWAGIPLLALMAAALAIRLPVWALVGVAGWTVVYRIRRPSGPSPDEEAGFLRGIATELSGGGSPRSALIAAAARWPQIIPSSLIRSAVVGLDSSRIAVQLEESLPLNGRLAGAAWAVGSESGAPLGRVMRLLSDRAAERGRLVRERRALTAQARATAWLIAGLPLVLFAVLSVTGRVSLTSGIPIAFVGGVLQAAGISIVLLMLRGTH